MTTSVSRVVDILRRRPSAGVPRGEFIVDHRFARDYLRWRAGGPTVDRGSDHQALIDLCRALKLDIVCIHSAPAVQEAVPGGADRGGIGLARQQGLFVFWVVNGAFQMAMSRRGAAAFLLDIVTSPDRVRRALDGLGEQSLAIMAQGVRAGAHGIIIADDIAYQRGTYTSADFVQQDLLPIWQRQVVCAKDLGVPIFLHSDGNLNTVLPLVVAAGFDGLQCIEPAAGMDIGQIQRKYGGDLCLMGNVDPALLNQPRRPADMIRHCDGLRQSVGALMASAGGAGGLIFGTCSGLYAGMSPELVDFMYRLAWEADAAARGPSPQE